MQNNQIGLFLNWSVIGAQGASGDPRDNKWLGTSWNSSNPNTHVEGTDGTLSRFWVRNTPAAPSVYIPQYNNYSGVAAIPISTTTGSWGGGCVYTSGASFKTDGALDDGTQDLSALLQLQEPESDREQSLQYLAQYNLYDRLVSDMELTTANSEFESFVSERTSNNVGKLHQIVTGFRSARSNGTDLENGMNLLQTVQPENSVEQTLKDVFNILYGNAADLSSMDGDGEKRLREIAELCPLDYGFGVYTARAALLKLDTLPKQYFAECESVPSPTQIGKKLIEEEENDFNAYPNPTSAALTVNYRLEEGQSGLLQIMDISGRVVREQELRSDQNSIEIQITDVSGGLYFLNVEVDGQTRYSERISVVRP